MTLHEKAVALMAARKPEQSFKVIAEAIEVSPAWVSAFARGEIPDPGVIKVQKLVDYFEGGNHEL